MVKHKGDRVRRRCRLCRGGIHLHDLRGDLRQVCGIRQAVAVCVHPALIYRKIRSRGLTVINGHGTVISCYVAAGACLRAGVDLIGGLVDRAACRGNGLRNTVDIDVAVFILDRQIAEGAAPCAAAEGFGIDRCRLSDKISAAVRAVAVKSVGGRFIGICELRALAVIPKGIDIDIHGRF